MGNNSGTAKAVAKVSKTAKTATAKVEYVRPTLTPRWAKKYREPENMSMASWRNALDDVS